MSLYDMFMLMRALVSQQIYYKSGTFPGIRLIMFLRTALQGYMEGT